MKLAFFILLNLLLFGSYSCARTAPEDYWKSMMKDQSMPEAIKGLIDHDPPSPSDKNNRHVFVAGNANKFTKSFDTRQPAIIYHSTQTQPKDEKSQVKNFNLVHEKETSDIAPSADGINN